jgi:hypothetical protein
MPRTSNASATNNMIPSALEQRVTELEGRLEEETMLRELLEQRLRNLEKNVPCGGEQGNPGYDLPGEWADRFRDLEARMGELKQKVDFDLEETAGERLERVGMSQDYSKSLYYDMERGKFPEQFHLKSAIHRALGELISKPSHKKNPIEQRLDDLFIEYLPPKFLNSTTVKRNLDAEVAPVLEEYGKGMIQSEVDQWDLPNSSSHGKLAKWDLSQASPNGKFSQDGTERSLLN